MLKGVTVLTLRSFPKPPKGKHKAEDCFRTILLIDFYRMSIAMTVCFIGRARAAWCMQPGFVNRLRKNEAILIATHVSFFLVLPGDARWLGKGGQVVFLKEWFKNELASGNTKRKIASGRYRRYVASKSHVRSDFRSEDDIPGRSRSICWNDQQIGALWQ